MGIEKREFSSFAAYNHHRSLTERCPYCRRDLIDTLQEKNFLELNGKNICYGCIRKLKFLKKPY